MTDSQSFERLIEKVRAGDDQAAADLVRLYEPEVRRFVHFRLTTPALRRFVDSLDICQSVLANFFVHLDRGGLQLDNPDQLRRLLITMARNKLHDHARKMKAARRDARRLATSDGHLETVADSTAEPGDQVMTEELVVALRSRLSDDELYLVDERFAGRSWNDLAEELDTGADALRKRMTRAMDRAAAELGFVEETNE